MQGRSGPALSISAMRFQFKRERRKTPRTDQTEVLTLLVPTTAGVYKRFPAVSINLSEDGIAVECPTELQPDSFVKIDLKIEDGVAPAQITARVVYSRGMVHGLMLLPQGNAERLAKERFHDLCSLATTSTGETSAAALTGRLGKKLGLRTI